MSRGDGLLPGKIEKFILELNLFRPIFHDSDRETWGERMRVERERKRTKRLRRLDSLESTQ